MKPIVLSIAGFDPCGGAGVLADVKTFEKTGVYGMAVNTGITIQSESHFKRVEWCADETLSESITTLFENYSIPVVKIGLTKSLEQAHHIVQTILSLNPDAKIILDPIIRSSSGFTIWDREIIEKDLNALLSKLFLITPNYNEAQILWKHEQPEKIFKRNNLCNILLKGGHNLTKPGCDVLFYNRTEMMLDSQIPFLDEYNKHGSGCVMSSALCAYLALGNDLPESCILAKRYTEKFLSSTTHLLGYHA